MKKNFWLLMAATMTSAVSAVETTENMAKAVGPQPQDELPTSDADEQAINNLTQKITTILPEIKQEIGKTGLGKGFLKGVDDNDAAKELAVWIKNLDLSRYDPSEVSFLDYLDIVQTLGDSEFPQNWCRFETDTALKAISKTYNANNKIMDFSKVLFEEPN